MPPKRRKPPKARKTLPTKKSKAPPPQPTQDEEEEEQERRLRELIAKDLNDNSQVEVQIQPADNIIEALATNTTAPAATATFPPLTAL